MPIGSSGAAGVQWRELRSAPAVRCQLAPGAEPDPVGIAEANGTTRVDRTERPTIVALTTTATIVSQKLNTPKNQSTITGAQIDHRTARNLPRVLPTV